MSGLRVSSCLKNGKSIIPLFNRSSCNGLIASRFSKNSTVSSSVRFNRSISSFRPCSVTKFNSSNVFKQESDEEIVSQTREVEEADVVIVGAGPAGLSAAIRLKQNAISEGRDVRIVVIEKGAEIGAHTLSGAVIETGPLSQLFPDWKELGAPLLQPALKDEMKFLTKNLAIPIPHPPNMSNSGNYIISLGNLVKWMGEKAEELDIEIFAGFGASEVVYGDKGQVLGVATNDFGLDKNFKPKSNFERGIEIHGKITLFAEGCHGSLSKQVIKKFELRDKDSFQTYGLGIKELWEVDPAKHHPGKITHTIGYPLDNFTYGGSFIYHMQDNLVSLGIVVGLDYENPYLSPYQEFQRYKSHPFVRNLLEGGRVLSYGARSLVEGGLQSLPKLVFPGGALIGDSAGLVNVPKIKGTHNAILSGILVADSISKSLDASEFPSVLTDYQTSFDNSPIYKELKEVRNIRPSFHSPLGLFGGVAYSGLDTMFLKGRVPFTLKHKIPDYAATLHASQCLPIEYPKPDNKITFDILTSVSRTGTNHADNQPVHLRVSDLATNPERNYIKYAGLEQKFCPAGVYEYVDDGNTGKKKFQINSQNCIHCKTCDIKDPEQKINWTVPEGGGGPQYVDL
ncbi:Electron transfer flavoprotein-ubiquinone oxidoreductase, mitochondrial [Smittium mucronatum]|uniref:Electron transfer flavoprotein-ubiquinone oxidoreductase n=1 Tax=Smittium mucronatum TaxID=133383 RepID=A0A1R0GTA7_9FUNG|nr:Electron transfer flavoprotein-ubiquinone oxidoreductase, mitochondrial [Smittium mucronatum]